MCAWELSDHRHGTQQETDEHGSSITHVDPSRLPIVFQKPDEASDQGRQHEGDDLIALEQGRQE